MERKLRVGVLGATEWSASVLYLFWKIILGMRL